MESIMSAGVKNLLRIRLSGKNCLFRDSGKREYVFGEMDVLTASAVPPPVFMAKTFSAEDRFLHRGRGRNSPT